MPARMARRAKFITFEGLEGCGKTTQIRAVEKHFRKIGKKVLATREPGGTDLGNELRSLLLMQRKEPLSSWAELFLMEAARAQHYTHVLRQALDTYDLVLCDRFTDATLAYQGGGRGLDPKTIELLNEKAAPGCRPDLTLFLDLEPRQALKRALTRMSASGGVREDRFENEELAFHTRVRETYLDIARREPKRLCVVDAVGSPETITSTLISRICERLSLPP
ncbi:MAG TPA: dTMP kinase [Bdellovibrionota bacterium]|nr:dTMP kinase [Bdellovibrionota bacterium]